MVFLFILVLLSEVASRDESFIRGNFGAGAQRMHYGTNQVAIARDSVDSIRIFTAGTSTILRSFFNMHKADIATFAFNQAGTRLASGG